MHSLYFLGMACDVGVAGLVARGDLFAARHLAVQGAWRFQSATGPFATATSKMALDESTVKECAADFTESVGHLLDRPEHEHLIDEAHSRHRTELTAQPAPRRGRRVSACFGDEDQEDGWLRCCSSLRATATDCFASAQEHWACCNIGPNGTRAFLRLPALREISLTLRLPTGALIRMAQDGLLRPFDVPTVLWPGGYLLAQFASDPRHCAAWRGGTVLELGSGVGAVAVAAVGCGTTVLATDAAPRSLALTRANAALNGVPRERLRTMRFDWESDSDLARVAGEGPFAAVIGASLEFERWPSRFWSVVERLASAGTQVVLAHTSGAFAPGTKLALPAGSALAQVETVSGLEYGMHTRWADDEADFEIVTLRRE